MAQIDHNGFRIPDLIIKKRNGGELTEEEVEYFVRGVVDGGVQDSQLGAMLMAMVLKGLSNEETTCLTRAMMMSGDTLSWPVEWNGRIVDKHSTGGVGDKISLVLAPALAACGMKVPMVSGRGLGHTGGTLDKLESIPGFSVSMTMEQMRSTLEEVGCCIVGQTEALVPADKKMYATRDVTGTVDSVGLIAASIISKKAAEQVSALVLDVKFGKGAVFVNKEYSKELAQKMVAIGKGLGISTVALLTDMENPIGKMIGNALEVAESINCLHGNGPNDLEDLVIHLGGQLLSISQNASSLENGYNKIKEVLCNGKALEVFRQMVIAQGADADVASKLCGNGANVFDVLPKAKNKTNIVSTETGFVHGIDARACAESSLKLGAGRSSSSDPINYAVGIQLCCDIGSSISKGDKWMTVHHDCEQLPQDILDTLTKAIEIRPEPKSRPNGSRVAEVIS